MFLRQLVSSVWGSSAIAASIVLHGFPLNVLVLAVVIIVVAIFTIVTVVSVVTIVIIVAVDDLASHVAVVCVITKQ